MAWKLGDPMPSNAEIKKNIASGANANTGKSITPPAYNLPPTDKAWIESMQKGLRDNISNATGAQFDENGNNTRPADSWYALTGTPKPGDGGGTTSGQGSGGSYGGASSGASLANQLADYQKQQALAALVKSRDNALSNLNAEKATIQPKYYDARNTTSANSQQSARNFAEFLAARGGTSSGAGAQAELTRNMSLQGNLGSLGRQETADYSDIERRRSDVGNAYESDVASATAGAEASRMQALLNDFYQQQQRDLQIAGLTGMFNNQKTLAGQQFDYNKTRDNVQDSQWQQQFDYSKEADARDYDYKVGRDDVSDAQWAKQFAESVKQNGIANALSQAKASSSGSSGSGGGLSLAQKISIWKISGQAPEGIPGVAPGTKVYDEVAARKAAEKSGTGLWDKIKGVISSVAGATQSGVSDDDISKYLK